jgi:hypothetical protein
VTSKSDIKASATGQEDFEKADGVPATATWIPQCVYLYRLINAVGDHHANVFAYLEDTGSDIQDNEIEGIVRDMLVRISNGTLKPIGRRFENVIWNRRSYVVVVLDDENRILDKDGFEMRLKEGPINTSDAFHTFSDEKNILPFDHVTGVRMLNKISKKHGEWPSDPRQPEYFLLRMKFRPRAKFSEAETRTHDDSATNLGPPPQP